MKHARPDYDRFQDPAFLIPADEPVMLFRAQDKHFIKVLQYYRTLVDYDQGDPQIIEAITRHLALAKRWPVKKSPDMPALTPAEQKTPTGEMPLHDGGAKQ